METMNGYKHKQNKSDNLLIRGQERQALNQLNNIPTVVINKADKHSIIVIYGSPRQEWLHIADASQWQKHIQTTKRNHYTQTEL